MQFQTMQMYFAPVAVVILLSVVHALPIIHRTRGIHTGEVLKGMDSPPQGLLNGMLPSPPSWADKPTKSRDLLI
ncbi:MAG: hypothetical protein NXY57DRAFT_978722 [Lentinula lateritia]|nr:MAG: hypothetical protein NXY57DRAFT_978722 [Lentinula lateritia]